MTNVRMWTSAQVRIYEQAGVKQEADGI